MANAGAPPGGSGLTDPDPTPPAPPNTRPTTRLTTVLAAFGARVPKTVLVALAALVFLAATVAAGLLYHDKYPGTRQAEEIFRRDTALPYIGPMLRYDAVHYLDIAQDGYGAHPGMEAFFPLYPAVVHGLVLATHLPLEIAALALSWLAAIGAAIVLYRWFRFEMTTRQSAASPWWALGLMAVFPASFFLALPYSESLFILLTASALYAWRRQRPILTAALAAAAALTRVPGAFLAIFFAAEYVKSRQWSDWRRLAPILGPGLGIGLYGLYLWWLTGNPLQFLVAQRDWDRFSGGNFVTSLWASITPTFVWLAAALIVMIVATWRELGWTWGLYATACVVLPAASGTVLSINRFALAVLPLFLGTALWLAKSRRLGLAWFYTVSATVLLTWNITLFYNGVGVG